MTTRNDTHAEIARLRQEAKQRRRQAAGLWAEIDRLDGSDPEDGDAARVWTRQARHAEDMANEAERWADRLEDDMA